MEHHLFASSRRSSGPMPRPLRCEETALSLERTALELIVTSLRFEPACFELNAAAFAFERRGSAGLKGRDVAMGGASVGKTRPSVRRSWLLFGLVGPS